MSIAARRFDSVREFTARAVIAGIVFGIVFGAANAYLGLRVGLTGAALSICALIAGLPGLSFAVGIYLPLGTLAPVFVGGIVRRVVESRHKGKEPESDPGVLAASGMIAGEGLAGVLIAFLIAAGTKWTGLRDALAPIHFAAKDFTHLRGASAVTLGIVVVLAVCALLFRAGRSARAA